MDIPKLDFYWQYVEHWADADPAFPSLREGERRVSAGEFARLVDQLAMAFLDLGIKKGDRIVTILPNGIDYVLTLVAAGKVGAITVPLDVKFKLADLERFLSHADPALLVAVPRAQDHDIVESLNALGRDFQTIKKITVGSADFGQPFEGLLERRLDLESELDRTKRALHRDEGAVVVFTGGTTGVPKAALLSHYNMALMSYLDVTHMLGKGGISGRTKNLSCLPPSHVGGTVEFNGSAIVGGMEMILLETWSPTEVLDITSREGIPWIGGVPTMFAILLSMPNLSDYDLSALKLAVCSGEKIPLELILGIRAKIAPIMISGYGSTEAGAEVTLTEPDEDPQSIADGYAGKALPTAEIKIVDDDGNPLPPGQVGEVITGGPLGIRSYYNMPEEDEAGFTEDGWVKSGDLGYLTEDGGLYIVGRKKQIIRVGGYTVLPTEVEEVAMEHPSVAAAAAIGMSDPILFEVVWLAVMPDAGKTVDRDAVMALCKERLAKFKVPKNIIVMDMLPFTRIGKVDRPTLKTMVGMDLHGTASAALPGTRRSQ
jgi:acyl-CoA synthetase (AMP-forming)/AMP-acid ligase II